jgi:hypothetical protein
VINLAHSPHILFNMARPIRVKFVLKTESLENGTSNRNTGVFNIDNLLKLALVFPYSTENARPKNSSHV